MGPVHDRTEQALARNDAPGDGEDRQGEPGRASAVPAGEAAAAQATAADRMLGTEWTGESERGEGGVLSTQHSSTGGGGTTRKRLLGGHAAKAAARHRQRVALQQAMRERSAEELSLIHI